MALPIWENLPKNQGSNEKIEEAIAAAIAAHNANEAAHLAEGQSLQSHRASEVIDHLVKSVVEAILADGAISSRCLTADQIIGKDFRTAEDVGEAVDGIKYNSDGIQMFQGGEKKVDIPVSGNPYFAGYIYASGLFYLKSFMITNWESIDSWQSSITGTITNTWGNLLLGTTTSQNSVVWVSNETLGGREVNFALKSPYFQAHLRFWNNTNQYGYFGIGQDDLLNDPHGFGFKINNGNIYACVYNDDYEETAYQITGIDITEYHIYRAEMVSGESLKFFVDNVLKHQIAYDPDVFPTEANPSRFTFVLKTLEASIKRLSCESLLFAQDL